MASEIATTAGTHQKVDYGIASQDLSARWLELVQGDHVVANTTTRTDDGQEIQVRYGVRIHPHDKDAFMEFIESAGNQYDKISEQNSIVRYDGDFVAQLQLVRTLRPPPSPGFGESCRSSSTPPPYDPEFDSLVTGPLRLQLRPRVATLTLPPLTTPWDVYHNISPCDVRGHFLLLPTILNHSNWRGQALTKEDCRDLVHLTASIRPMGSLLTAFNSVGAGASQNHIHCHLWPSPPAPLLYRRRLDENDDDRVHDHSHAHQSEKEEEWGNDEDQDDSSPIHFGWDCYAVSRCRSLNDLVDIRIGEEDDDPVVEVSYLDYPCFCVQLSSTSGSTQDNNSLDCLARALWEVLSCLGDAPHNVGMINRPGDTAHSVAVDIYVFARSRERSPNVIPASKAGVSEMMGVFHCHNLQQLEELVSNEKTSGLPVRPMVQLLEDVNHEDPMKLWETIKTRLEGIS